VQGGRLRRITRSPANDAVPAWSHDGKWIYFASNRTGTQQVWKVSAEGGDPIQVTRKGGSEPVESEDGKTIYYVKDSKLWKVPPNGGEEIQVLDLVNNQATAVTRGGIYFLAGRELRYLSFATGTNKLILTAPKPTDWGLSVSPDEHWLLYTQVDQSGSDLMLVESFR